METKTELRKNYIDPFTLNMKEAHQQLTVKLDGTTLPNNPNLTYLGVILDRQLTFKQHIETLCGKVTWGALTSTLRTGGIALVYSAAEYAAPAWCRSPHVKKLDVTLNDTMNIVNGCLRPMPVKYLPVLSGIAQPSLRRKHHRAMLVKKAIHDTSNLLHACVLRAKTLVGKVYAPVDPSAVMQNH